MKLLAAIAVVCFSVSAMAQVQIGKGVQIGGASSSLPTTPLVLKGNNAGGAVAATAGTDYVIPSGNTATASALATTPTLCPALANGIAANGNANCVPVAPPLVSQPTPASTTILQALNNAKNAPVRVAIMGDSFTISCQSIGGPGNGPVNCANRWAEQLRIQLQSIYGSHGTGVFPVIAGAATFINTLGWSCTGSVSTSNILGPTQGSGNTLMALGPSASCTFHDGRNIAWDTLNTYCGTNASSVGISVNIDSGAFTGTACGSTSGSATAHVVTLAATSSTSHSVTFTNTAGSGTAYLYAAEGASGTTGVSIDNMGFGGGLAALYGSAATTQLAFSDLIPGGTQALIYMDQTNDAANSVATGTFSTNIQNIITHEQALTSAPTVILAIPPVDVVNGTDPMAPYTAVQNSLCSTNSLTCINIQNRGTTVGATAVGWGTTYIPSTLWDLTGAAWPTGNAGVHPSDAGNLDEFQMIYASLVNPTVSSGGGCSTNCSFTGTGSTAAITTTSAGATSAEFKSTSVNGSQILIDGTGAGVDQWGIVSGSTAANTAHAHLLADYTVGVYSWKQTVNGSGAGVQESPSLMVPCWSSVADVTTTACDTGMSRFAATQVGAGPIGGQVAINLATAPGGAPTFSPGAGVTSIVCAASYTCTNTRGELTIVGGTATTGTIATFSFSTTLAVAPGLCMVMQNQGAPYIAVGHGIPSTTGFTITAGVSISGATTNVDYHCIP